MVYGALSMGVLSVYGGSLYGLWSMVILSLLSMVVVDSVYGGLLCLWSMVLCLWGVLSVNGGALYGLWSMVVLSLLSMVVVITLWSMVVAHYVYGLWWWYMVYGGIRFLTLSPLFPGTIFVARSLSTRAGTVLRLEVGAQDGGGVTAEVNARVNISVLPSSAHVPAFQQPQYEFSVAEDTPPGTSVGSVKAINQQGNVSPF